MISKMLVTATRPCFLLFLSLLAITCGPKGSVTSVPALPSGASRRTTLPSKITPEEEQNSLEEALHLIQRARREIGDEVHYSRSNRYRYPLQRKRTLYGGEWADNPDWPVSHSSLENMRKAEEDSDYNDDYDRFSSLRGDIQPLATQYEYGYRQFPERRRAAMKKAVAFLPSFDPDDRYAAIEERRRRRNDHSFNPSPRRIHQDIPRKKIGRQGSLGIPHYFPDEEDEKFYLNALRNSNFDQTNFLEKRHKREIEAVESHPVASSMKTSNHSTLKKSFTSVDLHKTPVVYDARSKRAFRDDDVFKYQVNHMEEDKDRDDFLTREYFKAIARAVGNKRNNGGLPNDFVKRIPALSSDAFPIEMNIIQSLQSELRAAEEELTEEAEQAVTVLSRGEFDGPEEMSEIQAALRDILRRLEELHEAKDALQQLLILHERKVLRKRAQDLVGDVKKKSSPNETPLEADIRKRIRQRSYEEEMKEAEENKEEANSEKKRNEGELEEEENLSSTAEDKKKKKDAERFKELDERKKKFDVIQPFFGNNRRDECPVLEKVLMSCVMVSELAHDNFLQFVEPCLRHEVCYMCGSSMDVSQTECDNLLSSGLESKCEILYNKDDSVEDKMKCLESSTMAYKLLSDSERYDSKGGCTFDPCVRELLDSR